MPGFFISNDTLNITLQNRYPQNCVFEDMQIESMTLKRATLNKFMNDKTFSFLDDIIVILDGYLLNKKSLLEKYDVADISELMVKMYKQAGDEFFAVFRGSFAGALYDKKQDKWIIFTNHIGDNAVFYTCSDDFFCAGSQINYVLEACREKKIQLSFDENAAYQMLTFGYMEDNSTYANEIKRLRGGTYLFVSGGKAVIKEYHTFKKISNRFAGLSENEIIDLLDVEFERAVSLEYEKDEEYGYKHLADMSGGLDSRMAVWLAHESKKRKIQLMTYCKSDYLDETISKKIAEFWKDELLIKPLDDANFLYDIDEITGLNWGLSLYYGITGGKRMLESLNMNLYGLEHTGMIGDVVIGSFYKSARETDNLMISGKYSEKLNFRLDKAKSDAYHSLYESHELYLLYTRAFQGAANTHLIRKNFTEVASPFLDVDFLQFCLDIPLELRIKHNLYKKWIIQKHRDASAFKWEKTNSKITDSAVVTFFKKAYNRAPQRILSYFGLSNKLARGMNPIGYWISHNEEIKNFFTEYSRDGLKNASSITSSQLLSDLTMLIESGTAVEKTMALTVLSSIRLYFGENNEFI